MTRTADRDKVLARNKALFRVMKAGFRAADAAPRNNPLGRCENLLQHEGVDEDHAVLEHVQAYKQLWTVEETFRTAKHLFFVKAG